MIANDKAFLWSRVPFAPFADLPAVVLRRGALNLTGGKRLNCMLDDSMLDDRRDRLFCYSSIRESVRRNCEMPGTQHSIFCPRCLAPMVWYNANLTDEGRVLQHKYQCERCGLITQLNDQSRSNTIGDRPPSAARWAVVCGIRRARDKRRPVLADSRKIVHAGAVITHPRTGHGRASVRYGCRHGRGR